jgi:hypothetical protein
MKKALRLFVLALFLFQGVEAAWAVERGTAEYERLKEYKRMQREKRASGQQHGPSSKGPGFWDKEAVRSGLSDVKQNTANFFKKINPSPFFREQNERYQARKAAAAGK